MENPPFGITRDEVLNLAAQKLTDAYCDDESLSERATEIIRTKVEKGFAERLNAKIDEFLSAEMEKLISQEIIPVDIWGKREGQPTTIRAQLAKRARDFWDVKIDREGRENVYGGTPRSKALMQEILKDEFSKAVKENAEVIVAEFKAALKQDAVAIVTGHIDKLINIKER